MDYVRFNCANTLLKLASPQTLVPLIVGALYSSFLFLQVPIARTFQFGANEGYELSKAMLCSSGFSLYGDIWNDQPPLHTGLLSVVFKLFGPSLLHARITAVIVAGILVGALFALARRSGGYLCGMVAVLFFIAWQNVLQLSVSVMLDPTAWALGLCSAISLLRSVDAICVGGGLISTKAKTHLVLSGVLMGLAVQTKLTISLLIPSVLLESLLLLCHPETKQKRLRLAANCFALWCGSCLAALFIVWIVYPGESLGNLLNSHFSQGTRQALGYKSGSAFTLQNLQGEWLYYCAGLGGIVLAVAKRNLRAIVPVSLIFTVLIAHLMHRPYWYYYSLHFAIPTAWLIGLCSTSPLQLWRINRIGLSGISRPALTQVGCLVPFAAALLTLPETLRWNWKAVSDLTVSIDKIPIVKHLSNPTQFNQWVFVDSPIYAFHAGKLIPPELAVLPSKRFWSGQISEAEITQLLQKYQPAQIYLERNWSSNFTAFLQRDYRHGQILGHYIRKAGS